MNSEINDYQSFFDLLCNLRDSESLNLKNVQILKDKIQLIQDAFESKKALEFLKEQVSQYGDIEAKIFCSNYSQVNLEDISPAISTLNIKTTLFLSKNSFSLDDFKKLSQKEKESAILFLNQVLDFYKAIGNKKASGFNKEKVNADKISGFITLSLQL